MQKTIIRFNILFIVILVTGCTRSTEDITSVPAQSLTIQASSGSAISETPNIQTVLPTSTIIPTLPVGDARTHLLELMNNNGGCRLPCLFGIVPGTSTYQEAQGILVSLSSLSDFTGFIPEGGIVSPNYVEDNLLLATNLDFDIDTLSDNQLVERVGFRAQQLEKITSTENGLGFEPIFDSNIFGERINYFMLHSILSNYGIPDSVMLGTVANIPPREPPGGFHILLLYPEQGIMIEYTTQMHETGSYISGCPANAHVEMDLYPPGDADSFFALLEETGGDNWAVKKNWYKPLEETNSLSVDEFYEIFREPTDKCIETLAKLWPSPEP